MNADKESVLVLAIADEFLRHARESIDKEFGPGHARAHPGLVMTYLSGSFGLLNATAKRLPPQ